jgi:hypothetical protein
MLDHLGTVLLLFGSLLLLMAGARSFELQRRAEAYLYVLSATAVACGSLAFGLGAVPNHQELVAGLEQKLVEQTRGFTAARNAVSKLSGEVKERDTRILLQEQQSDVARRSLQTSVKRLQDAYEARFGSLANSGGQNMVVATDHVDAIVTTLDGLREDINKPPLPPSPLADLADTMPILERINGGVSTSHYELRRSEPLGTADEWRAGTYQIVLKDAASGLRFAFERRKYTLSNQQSSLERSILQLHRDIIAPIRKVIPLQWFIRCNADGSDYVGGFEEKFEFREIAMLSRSKAGRYSGAIIAKKIDSVSNAQLPNLRARYVQLLGEQMGSNFSMELLENIPETGSAELELGCEHFVSIKWRAK